MDREALHLLLDYHYWARDRMLQAVARLTTDQFTHQRGGSFGSVRDTVVHMYSAEWIWHSRWKGISPTEPIAGGRFPDVESLSAAWRELEGRVRLLLDELTGADLAAEMDYRLISGAEGRSVFWHMLQHVVNHATYHRGQVTTLLRQIGATPPESQDLIAFYRERSG
jgi:uncharacterized damage-inducible protein DinB